MKRLSLGVVAAVFAASAVPGYAHYSYAMFDHTKQVTLKSATVAAWEWTSPHTWLYLLVPGFGKDPTKISVEDDNPGLLRRLGFSKGSMSPGEGNRLHLPSEGRGERGALNAVQLANGHLLGERTRLIR